MNPTAVRPVNRDINVVEPPVRYVDVLEVHDGPFGSAAMQALEPLEGSRVLDVGCSTGSTTWALADQVGAEGRVFGVEVSRAFLDAARMRRRPDPRVSFLLGDGSAVRVGDEPVDLVYSRFGVLFFASPVKAFAHLRSLARPGGKIAFAAWRDASENPWVSVPVQAAAPLLGTPRVPPAGAPGPFAFAAPATIRSVLGEAGWVDITIDALSVDRPLPGDDHLAAQAVLQLTPPLVEGLRARPEVQDDVIFAVAEALRDFERDGSVVMPAAAWIVSATSPG